MRVKRVALVCVITFLIGGVCGSAYAYATHSSRSHHGQSVLAFDFEQMHENREVEQFINEQEQLRPDGLEESKIETGSKYTGITYNAGTPVQPDVVKPATVAPAVPEEKKEGLLSRLFGKKDKDAQQKPEQNDASQTNSGRIKIQSGSLNVRAQSNTNSEVLGQVYKDDIVEIIGQDGAWYQIVTKDNLQGYVSANYVEILSEAE